MGKLYCILGKSASGKDTVYRLVLSRLPELRTYVLYTTRPRRDGETEGKTYIYTSSAALSEFKAAGKVIESRTYETVYGPWTYATIDDGQIDLKAGDYLSLGTLESYLALREYFGTGKVVPLYIEVEDGERLMRALLREREQKEPKYGEMCRRFLADSSDFSEEKLKAAGISIRFYNNRPEECAEKIIGAIK